MKNPMRKLRQSSIISEKPGCLSEKMKSFNLSQAPTAIEFNFFAEFLHTFST